MKNLPELFDLSGRIAVVTGGAGLLGAEFCATLFEAGATTVIADIDEVAAKEIAEQLNREDQSDSGSVRAIPMLVDVSSKASVEELFSLVAGAHNRVDILVNSAAIDPKFDPESRYQSSSTFRFEDFPLKLWQGALDTTLTGTFLCCQAAGKIMISQSGGVIINVSSIYGIVGPDQRIYQSVDKSGANKPGYYSATKAGILGLTRYLATYYAGKNIRVNALTPGGVFNDHDQEFVEAYAARTVLGRMANKDEMNGALLFLASDASTYMTGNNLVVDGGWSAW
jgi:2-deoxy-D-gluconate 3-dehydrogenase